jgi:ketosteroid isomerase-like protein
MPLARRFVTACAATLTLAIPAAAQRRPSPSPADESARLRNAIEAGVTRMTDAYNRGDMAGFIQSYADDVWVFPPNDQPFQGPAAAIQFFQRSYDGGFRNLQLTTTGVDRQGPMAYETGIYTGQFPTPGQPGAITRDNGKYVHVWKRAPNGVWRTHLVMWSSNLPPPGTTR